MSSYVIRDLNREHARARNHPRCGRQSRARAMSPCGRCARRDSRPLRQRTASKRWRRSTRRSISSSSTSTCPTSTATKCVVCCALHPRRRRFRSFICLPRSSRTGDRVRGLDVGADGYLTHPLEPKVLVSSINAMLRARNAETVRHASDAKLRAVFDLAPIGIATLAADGTFTRRQSDLLFAARPFA